MAPARWQSSQRPLFVRTVWMDGQRHAVLSADDPALQYVSSSGGSLSASRFLSSGNVSSPPTTPVSVGPRDKAEGDLKHCLVKLQLLRSRARARTASVDSPAVVRQTSFAPSRPSTRARTEPKSDCDDRSNAFDNDIISARQLMVGHYNRPYLPCIFRCRSTSSDSSEDVDDPFFDTDSWLPSVESFLPELQLNPLSERVLQWLDLAGRTPSTGDAGKCASPPGNIRAPALPPRRATPATWCRPKRRPTVVALAPASPPLPPPSAGEEPPPQTPSRPQWRRGRVPADAFSPASSGSSTDSPTPPSEPLLIHARGFSTHRRPSFALCNSSPPAPPCVADSPPSSPASLSPSEPLSPAKRYPPLTTPVLQAYVPSPPLVFAPPRFGGGAGGDTGCGVRPQLHIFLPALPHDRAPLLLREIDSDGESVWSES